LIDKAPINRKVARYPLPVAYHCMVVKSHLPATGQRAVPSELPESVHNRCCHQ